MFEFRNEEGREVSSWSGVESLKEEEGRLEDGLGGWSYTTLHLELQLKLEEEGRSLTKGERIYCQVK